MPQQERSPGTDVVDIRISVGVEDARALAALDKSRDSAHAAKGPDGGIHAARNDFLGARKPGFRTLGFHQVGRRANGPESRVPGKTA